METTMIVASFSQLALYWTLGLTGILLLLCIMVVASSISSISKARQHWKKIFENTGGKTLTLLILLLPMAASAQETPEAVPAEAVSTGLSSLAWWMIWADVFLLVVLLSLVRVLRTMISYMKDEAPVTEEAIETKPSFVKRLMQKMTATVPIEREEEVMTDHVYDGIRELDNKLPPWWLYMFYVSIIFAPIYIVYYHFGPGELQEEEYQAELVAAEIHKKSFLKEKGSEVDENTVTLLEDDNSIDIGKSIYTANCAACHGQLGEGGVGPNLTDPYWLHGGSVNDVFKTIKYGVPAKGMIPWESTLNPGQIQKVTSYILKMQGSNPPNAKEPQGELVSPELVQNTADSTQVK